MLRALLSVMLLMSLSAVAQTDTVVADPIEHIRWHVRVQPDNRRPCRLELRWNVIDSLTYMYASVEVESPATDDWSNVLVIETGQCDGERSKISSNHFKYDGDAWRDGLSLRIDGNATAGSTVSAGSRHAGGVVPVSIDMVNAGGFQTVAGAGCTIVRDDFEIATLERPQYSPFADTDSIIAYLDTTHDPAEGIWTYYDSNSDEMKASVKSRYTIATVRNSDGDYDVIYLDGSNDAGWTAGRIKGTMRPATFPGIYDLEWLEPSGRRLKGVLGATVTDDMLTTQFPRWNTTVRYRRLK